MSSRHEQLLQDMRYACRGLRRQPGYAAIVILTLAVAIGMNTAIFSVFNAVVLRPLAYPHADRLVWLSAVGANEESMVLAPEFVEWRERTTSFDRMVAYGTVDHTLASRRGATRVRAATITHDFWDLAGAAPAAGRVPRTEERDGIMLSHGFAQRWFADDTDVIGRTVTLDGRPVSILGILPDRFKFHLPGSSWIGFRPRDVDVYLPLTVSGARRGPMQLLSVVGRLKTGATRERAEAEINAILARSEDAHPNPFGDRRRVRAVPLHDELVGAAGRALVVLLGAVGFVLLIACANASGLLIARAAARQREIAVRMALGAGRARVLRQLFVESLLLTVMGTAAGLLLAQVGVAMIVRMDPHAIPRLAETTLDLRVLVVTIGACLTTAVVVGLAPALTVWKMDPHDTLKRGIRVASAARTSVRTRRVLVAGEVAVALVLLIGAGLMLKSAWRMHARAPGFEPSRILTAKVEFAGPQYGQPHRSIAFVDALLQRVKSEPGVEAATISTHGCCLATALIVEGDPEPAPDAFSRQAPIMINLTSAALKQVLGFRVVRGRWFTDDERTAVLNESLARRQFPGREAIGRRIQVSEDGPFFTIVGVVADLKYSQLDAAAEPEVYVPYARVGDGIFGVTALILTNANPTALAPMVRTIVSDIDRTQVADDVMSLEQALGASIAPRRLNLLLLGVFAAAALFLAVIGIYGVIAYSVTQRRHELGVRVALGAQPADVIRMVVRQGMLVAMAGIFAGLVAAVMLTRVMEGLLYEVQPIDPLTFAAVTAALASAALFACCIPAIRAARVDPVITLRYD
jgi:putative ABC transport system permease protein